MDRNEKGAGKKQIEQKRKIEQHVKWWKWRRRRRDENKNGQTNKRKNRDNSEHERGHGIEHHRKQRIGLHTRTRRLSRQKQT